jgi:hypothetical protein
MDHLKIRDDMARDIGAQIQVWRDGAEAFTGEYAVPENKKRVTEYDLELVTLNGDGQLKNIPLFKMFFSHIQSHHHRVQVTHMPFSIISNRNLFNPVPRIYSEL